MGVGLRTRIWWLAALLLTLSLASCKKDQAPPAGPAGKAPTTKGEEPRPPAAKAPAETPAEPAEAPAQEPAADAQPAGQEAPAKGPEEAPEATAEPEEAPERPATPSAHTQPKPALDRDRLKKVFIELWCAEQGGATPDDLIKLYHKYDYPPLANWYDLWNEALMDKVWARTTLEEARSRCHHVLKKEPAGEGGGTPEPPTRPDEAPAPAREEKPAS